MSNPPKLSGFLKPGSVVEFLQDNEAHIAWVLEESGGRLRLLTRTRREVKLPDSRLLPWTGPEYPAGATREEISHRLEALETRRREIMAELNPLELWDMAQGELERAPVEWFATLLWQEPGVNELAALGRALLGAKTHFKFNPPDFEIHPADKVEARLAQEREAKERESVVNAGHALLTGLWNRIKSGQPPLPPGTRDLPEARIPDDEVLKRLHAVLLAQVAGRSASSSEHDALAKFWESLKKSLPDVPHLPLQLAQAWGLLPPHHNHLLDEAGYAWGDEWSAEFADEIFEQLKRFDDLAASAAKDGGLDPTPFVSIDAATTRDIDDAFFVARAELPGGGEGFRCAIALARPTLAWDFGGRLDREVMNRVTSLYLPEGSGHMMPESLGTGHFSLAEGQPKPALVAEFLLDERGEVLDTTPRLAWITVTRNIAYPDAQATLDADSDAHLSLAMRLARLLLDRRLERGAVVIDRPEPVVSLEGEPGDVRVCIETRAGCPDAELLVSEFMILANCGLARWAGEVGVPLLHRTQNIALPPSATGVFNDPVDIARVVKLLAPPALECTPRRHAALACEAYATLTSPIRRYVDFLNMAQIQDYLATGAPRLSLAELEALIPTLSARIQEVGQIQRFRPRYWKLVYLAQHKRESFPALVVDDTGPYPTLALPDLQLQVRLPRNMLGEKAHPGMAVTVLFGRIDPLTNELKVLEAQEAE
ncbi:MAG: RNB domain-containing ribonuclease [Humidesulfovibrio sp.]|uniref:ribonuclease catalytic domain-containing protein n=1 Tax=Humidesulfovibrio sp. TaxID=2910988 RepID=UPI0027FD4983|nr:RNB domain-containing ribonuclease [Humidesulfovibrio sp.]MDQ7835184.1 RNB domain-containing ribonuclease [Humidesulfovibrio sp.]